MKKIKKIILSTIFFMILVPAGGVIIDKSISKFTETMCLMAGPYIFITTYMLFHKKSTK